MVTVYHTDIRALSADAERALALVTAQRRARIASMRRQEDRLRSLGAGLLLRCVLQVEHDDALTYAPGGRPMLRSGRVQFSLSHSGNYAVLAVSALQVGVDVQRIRAASPALTAYVSTEEEQRQLADANDPALAFSILWARKESIMKASGLGLSLRPDSLCVLPPDAPVHAAGQLWHLAHTVLDGHVLAAACTQPPQLRLQPLTAQQLLSDQTIARTICSDLLHYSDSGEELT